MLGPSGPGAVICAAGASLAPADKRLYALRDTTATVSCVPLIASSIMSKKIAEGTGALVLDVKVGSGAFMKELGQARELASTMVALGTDAGVTTRALLTDMSTPLGLTAGNALEVAESLEVLAGGGPADVVDLTVALALEMCAAAGRPVEEDAARTALADGRAMDIWRDMISRQGGDPDAPLPVAPETETVTAPADGVLTTLDALAVGVAAWRLGAGRARKEDPVQAVAGVTMHAKPGDEVRAGQELLTLHTATPERFTRAREALAGGIVISQVGSWSASDDHAPAGRASHRRPGRQFPATGGAPHPGGPGHHPHPDRRHHLRAHLPPGRPPAPGARRSRCHDGGARPGDGRVGARPGGQAPDVRPVPPATAAPTGHECPRSGGPALAEGARLHALVRGLADDRDRERLRSW